MITLRMGSHDPHVVFLQRMLNHALVHDRSIAVLDEDGAFGRLTDGALRRFQSTYTVPDGVAGPLSWRALGGIGCARHAGSAANGHHLMWGGDRRGVWSSWPPVALWL